MKANVPRADVTVECSFLSLCDNHDYYILWNRHCPRHIANETIFVCFRMFFHSCHQLHWSKIRSDLIVKLSKVGDRPLFANLCYQKDINLTTGWSLLKREPGRKLKAKSKSLLCLGHNNGDHLLKMNHFYNFPSSRLCPNMSLKFSLMKQIKQQWQKPKWRYFPMWQKTFSEISSLSEIC